MVKRVFVHAIFDGYPYNEKIVRMGTSCNIIGIKKDIRATIGRGPSDEIAVTINERE